MTTQTACVLCTLIPCLTLAAIWWATFVNRKHNEELRASANKAHLDREEAQKETETMRKELEELVTQMAHELAEYPNKLANIENKVETTARKTAKIESVLCNPNNPNYKQN